MGDYAVAFSTAASGRRVTGAAGVPMVGNLPNDATSPAFQAVAEATEEAVLNAMLAARTVVGHRGTVEALPMARVLPLLRARPAR